jgi:hypothetical protein
MLAVDDEPHRAAHPHIVKRPRVDAHREPSGPAGVRPGRMSFSNRRGVGIAELYR